MKAVNVSNILILVIFLFIYLLLIDLPAVHFLKHSMLFDRNRRLPHVILNARKALDIQKVYFNQHFNSYLYFVTN